MTAWVEQGNNLSGVGINSRDIRPLVAVARKTGQAKVTRQRATLVMLGNDMIDLEWEIEIRLMDLAVFATPSGPPPYQVF